MTVAKKRTKPKITRNIKNALRKLGKFINARCIYLVFFADDPKIIAGSIIWWCSKKHGYYARYLKRYSKKSMPIFDKTIRSANTVQIHNVDNLDDKWAHEKKIWQQNKIKAVICWPLISENKIIGYVGLNFSKEQKNWRQNDIDLLTTFSEIISSSLNPQEKGETIITLKEIIKAITSMIKKYDSYTVAHQLRTAKLCFAIAKELKLTKAHIKNIYLGALIHDIGKNYLSEKILHKPEVLSKREIVLIKKHPQAGYNIIEGLLLDPSIKEMILAHHERLDGSGYPKGLKGRQIKIGARILAVADAVDAIYSLRPYRVQRTMQETLKEIKKHAGTLFDRKVVDACIKVIKNKKFNFEGQKNIIYDLYGK